MGDGDSGKSGWIILIVGTVIILAIFAVIMFSFSPRDVDEKYIKTTLGAMFEEECSGSEEECKVAVECAAEAFVDVLSEEEIEEFANLWRTNEKGVNSGYYFFRSTIGEERDKEYFTVAYSCVSEIDYGMGMLTPFRTDNIVVE